MTRLISIVVVFFLMIPAIALQAAGAEASQQQIVLPRVMIFPFTSVGQADENGWIGSGIQQSLQADVAKAGARQITAPATQPAEVNPVALAAQAGASVAVVGGFQVVNGEVRATGAVVNTATGQPTGVLAATGPVKDLFKVEDSLGLQLQQALTQIAASISAEATTQPAASANPPATVYQPYSPPSYESNSTTYNYYYTPPADTYLSTPYYYPSYSYVPAYSYWPAYGGVFFWYSPVINCYRHHFDHDHGHGFGHHGINGFGHRSGFSGVNHFGNSGSNVGTSHQGLFNDSFRTTPRFNRSPEIFEGGPSITPRPSFHQFRSSSNMDRSFTPAGSAPRFSPAPSAPSVGGAGGFSGRGGGGFSGGPHATGGAGGHR